MHEITERAVCNNRAGWIFWRHSLSDKAKNVRAGWKIIVKIVSEQGLILGTAEYVPTFYRFIYICMSFGISTIVHIINYKGLYIDLIF